MRQDFIQDMNDPHQRRQYVEANAVNRWALKSTLDFEHSADVTAAWEHLARAINDNELPTGPDATDTAIAEHLNRSVPALNGDDNDRYIVVDWKEVSFGPGWSTDQIADMVARDFLPDAELIKAIEAARTDQTVLEAVKTSAQTIARERYEHELEAAPDSYDGPYADDELWDLETDSHHEPAPRVETCTYQETTAARPAHIHLELSVDRDFNPANLERQRAAEERLIGGTDQVCGSIDNVATRHLQELTGTSARIANDGYSVSIDMDRPVAPADRAHRTAPDTGRDAGPPLTADQESALPELTRSIEAALPPLERDHTQTLAMMVAAELPSPADVISSSDRVTLAEVIEHHERRMGSDQAPLPASIRLAELSFPQHPSAALHSSASDASPGPGGAPRTYLSAPDLER
ncbi:hypothetical protein ACIQH9_11395 [Pseudarthrobacter oxydans]|uniref:hypothetical protein n=1 Tax=Pseudarthrobacter oxydans TaxID=1671 RepID=UPI0037F93DC6